MTLKLGDTSEVSILVDYAGLCIHCQSAALWQAKTETSTLLQHLQTTEVINHLNYAVDCAHDKIELNVIGKIRVILVPVMDIQICANILKEVQR